MSMVDIYNLSNFWIWGVFGLILLLLELFIAGVFIIWFGLAALLTAFVLFIVDGVFGDVHLQIQILLFLVFSAISVYCGIKFFRKAKESDQPLLNQRTAQMFGKIVTLSEPIIDGYGHVRIDDTIWRVSGQDLPIGAKVCLIDYKNGAFLIEKVQ